MVNLKTIVKGQYDNLVPQSLNTIYYVIRFIKIHNYNSYVQNEIYGAIKYKQKAKTKKHQNDNLSLFLSFDIYFLNVCVVHHLKNSIFIANQWSTQAFNFINS